LLALVLWRREPVALGARCALFFLAVCGYLLTSSAALSAWLQPLWPLTLFGAIAVPFLLWPLADAIFALPRVPPWAWLLPAVALVHWCGLCLRWAGLSPATLWLQLGDLLTHLSALITVAAVLTGVLRGRDDDLVESRRAYRRRFILLIGAQVGLTLLVELGQFGQDSPLWLNFINVVVILVLGLLLGVPLLLDAELLARPRPTVRAPVVDPLVAALEAAMAERAYAEPGLTIGALAARLRVPEHQLRRTINGTLGHRNFSAYVNGFRLEEAARRLRQAEARPTPVLSIALDVGFASIGPFNRAFREAYGVTPSAWRRGRSSADSENS